MIRGGGWINHAGGCQAANRNWNTPDNRNNNLGFRLLAVPLELRRPTQRNRLPSSSSPARRKTKAFENGPALVASALEFILEGLHLNKKLNKKVLEGEISYWG